jgi:hypothetical protein
MSGSAAHFFLGFLSLTIQLQPLKLEKLELWVGSSHFFAGIFPGHAHTQKLPHGKFSRSLGTGMQHPTSRKFTMR